ncbi:MAG: acryloyl-CoA reductase [Gammaproteobacteria bacterium]
MTATNQSFSAMVVKEEGAQFTRAVETRHLSDLPDYQALVRVEYSSLNYKDALSTSGNRGVTRNYPHVPGIDAAGVLCNAAGDLPKGARVAVTGYDLGMNTWGGFSEYIRVPPEWLIPLPEGMTARQAMEWGTAGLTAGLCVDKLSAWMQFSQSSLAEAQVIVTGATGGVGSIAVTLLAELGSRVTAVTGKAEATDWLRSIGASEVISMDTLMEAGKPLQKTRWDAAVDVTGGVPLANLLAQLNPQAACACCGLVAGSGLPTTVLPFILRGVALLGIDSVEIPLATKARIFGKLATEWRLNTLSDRCTEVRLEGLPAQIDKMLQGQHKGRTLVNLM